MIFNIFLLVSIWKTNQDRKASLKTTILLSIHDIISTSFQTILMLFFRNYHVQDCNMSDSLLSINIYLSQLNTSLMSFISLDRYLHVKLSTRYQRQLKNRVSIVSLITGIMWPLSQLISSNIRTLS